jgi:predicted GNAT superfamily acetyltransferase
VSLTFRPVQTSDFEAILAINAAGYPGVVRLAFDELMAVLTNAPFFYVAEVDAQVAGYVIAYTDKNSYDGDEFLWFQARYASFLYIDQIAIAPTVRRVRVGSHFYRFVEQFAWEQELTGLVCEINLEPPNPISLNFHAKNGFVEVGVMDTPDGRKVSLRRKELSTPQLQ